MPPQLRLIGTRDTSRDVSAPALETDIVLGLRTAAAEKMAMGEPIASAMMHAAADKIAAYREMMTAAADRIETAHQCIAALEIKCAQDAAPFENHPGVPLPAKAAKVDISIPPECLPKNAANLTGKIDCLIRIDKRVYLAKIASKSLRKAAAFVAEHGAEAVFAKISGKLCGMEILDAGLSVAIKAASANEGKE